MSVLKLVIVSLTILNVCVSVERNDQKAAAIVEYVDERFSDGGYHFRYLTSDGEEREEKGWIDYYREDPSLKVRGFYKYIDSNGKPHMMYYFADDRGSRSTHSTTPLPVYTGTYPTAKIPPTTTPPTPMTPAAGMVSQRPITGQAIATLAGGGIGK